MQRRRGFTILDVLITVGIIALLAGLVFTALAPSRAKAKESACISNLRQIHASLLAYAADWGPNPSWPALEPLVPLPDTTLALREVYVKDKRIYFCPATSEAEREGWGSTYAWGILAAWGNGPSADYFKEKLERLGQSTDVLSCAVHDRKFYLPRERSTDPKLLGRYELHLLVSGSVVSRRVDAPRGSSLTPF
jgi:type II secretory pathway pseudopilin PulG